VALVSAVALAFVVKRSEPLQVPVPKANESELPSFGTSAPLSQAAYLQRQVPDLSTAARSNPMFHSSARTRPEKPLIPTCYPPPYPYLSNARCEEIKTHYATKRRPLLERIEELQAKQERTEAEEVGHLESKVSLLMSQEEERLAIKKALGPIGELNDLLQELQDLGSAKAMVSPGMEPAMFMECQEYRAIAAKIEAFYYEHPNLRQYDTNFRPANSDAKTDSLNFILQDQLVGLLGADRLKLKSADEMLKNLQNSHNRLIGMLKLSMKGTFIPVTNRNLKEDISNVSKQMKILAAEGEIGQRIVEVKAYILEIELQIAQSSDAENEKDLVGILGHFHEIYRNLLLLRIDCKSKKQPQKQKSGAKSSASEFKAPVWSPGLLAALAAAEQLPPIALPQISQAAGQQRNVLEVWKALHVFLATHKPTA